MWLLIQPTDLKVGGRIDKAHCNLEIPTMSTVDIMVFATRTDVILWPGTLDQAKLPVEWKLLIIKPLYGLSQTVRKSVKSYASPPVDAWQTFGFKAHCYNTKYTSLILIG